AHRSKSCKTALHARLAVIPSSTQLLPIYRTESMSSRPFNWRVFQQNRPEADIGMPVGQGILSRSETPIIIKFILRNNLYPTAVLDVIVAAYVARKSTVDARP
ncbi:MAG TPA: hypothetical protein VGG11_09180, partial [Xanthobacteraceae bacterium]